MATAFVLFLPSIVLSFHTTHTAHALSFKDVSSQAGLKRVLGRRRLKYGGAAVADLDADGYQDLIFGHHDDMHAEVYFNNRDGTFRRSNWGVWTDLHAVCPFRTAPSQRRMHFALVPGGGAGASPAPPRFYRVASNRKISYISKTKAGIANADGRGRSMIFMSLRPKRSQNRFVDALVMHAPPRGKNKNRIKHKVLQAISATKYKRRPMPLLQQASGPYGSVADVDNDGRVELITFQGLAMYKVTSLFRVREVTNKVFPRNIRKDAVAAVAELDFDNDGRMDLYIARSTSGELKWQKGRVTNTNDYLLRNVGGRYVDVTWRAGIPRGEQSRGVTAGDFNNDGWVDLLVTRYNKPDVFLINNKRGRFNQVNAGFRRKKGIPGDMGTAVDYDRDGRLDVILSEGDFFAQNLKGFYRIMRNVGAKRNFLLVRVANSPKRGATSLHAIVRVNVGGMTMVRRVGTPGTAVSVSYIELVHFGLGKFKKVNSVTVWWRDGSVKRMTNVKSNRLIVVGKV